MGTALVAGRGSGRSAPSRVLVEFHGAGVIFDGDGQVLTEARLNHRHDFLHGGEGKGALAGVFQHSGGYGNIGTANGNMPYGKGTDLANAFSGVPLAWQKLQVQW